MMMHGEQPVGFEGQIERTNNVCGLQYK